MSKTPKLQQLQIQEEPIIRGVPVLTKQQWEECDSITMTPEVSYSDGDLSATVWRDLAECLDQKAHDVKTGRYGKELEGNTENADWIKDLEETARVIRAFVKEKTA